MFFDRFLSTLRTLIFTDLYKILYLSYIKYKFALKARLQALCLNYGRFYHNSVCLYQIKKDNYRRKGKMLRLKRESKTVKS